MRRRRSAGFLVLLGFAALLLGGCGDSGTAPQPTAARLRVTPQAASLRLGETATLEVEFVDAADRPVEAGSVVTWSSDAPDVAEVDDGGTVRARAIGTATIEARSGSLTGSSTVTVRAPAPLTGGNLPVSAMIDSAGGTITATSVDGARFTLDVPRLALREPTQITLTPLASIDDFPTSTGPSAAVLLEPDGLQFQVPAELTIVGPGVFPSSTVGFSQSDDEFYLAPARLSGDTARVVIAHFSAGGATAATPEEVAALNSGTGDAESAARQGVTQELARAGQSGGQPNTNVIAQHLKDWFENGVIPGLEAATAGSRDVEDAIGEWIRWLTNAQMWADGHLESEIDRGRAAAAAALRAGIDRLNQQCRAQNDPSLADDVLHLAALAAFLGADEIDPALELEAVFADLCVRIVIEATLPDPFVQGSTLNVRAGLAAGDHPARYDTPLDITLQSATADLSRTSGSTGPGGEFTTDVRLRDGYPEVVIDIEVEHPDIAQVRAARRVTARARYRLDLFVDGAKQATLEPEDVAWLSLSLEKAEAPLPGAAITLSVLGGGSVSPASVTTDGAGLGASVYRAPEEADTVRVVASFAEGDEALADTVIIEIIEPKRGRIQIDDVYQAHSAAAYASQSGSDPRNDVHDDWMATPGWLSGDFFAAAFSGSASATGNSTHDSMIMPSDRDTLLMFESKGSVNGTVSANRAAQAGATLAASSEAHVIFDVLDAPVYYEIRARGVTTGGGISSVELSAAPTWQKIQIKEWHASQDTLVADGWLEPGKYSFDAGGSVWIGAGVNNPDGDGDAGGSVSYEVVFRIYDRKPKQEAVP